MIRVKKIISRIFAVAGILTCSAATLVAETPKDSSAFKQMLDSLGLTQKDLEEKVQSTLLYGGSSPVSFSGEARLKLQYHQFQNDDAQYLQYDRSYLQSNWEGNESFVRLGMVARAGRNAVLYSKIGFQNTLPGTNTNKKLTGDTTAQFLHDKNNDPAIIHEDMCAGLALRTVPASFMLKMGAVLWAESSPLTIWKSQPRTFGWEYLPFEVEQPIARYYEYNLAKGEKSGRAAWNKKAFQGINLESINLPANLYVNFLYGTYERYDNFEREYVDFSGDLAYAGEASSSPIKGKGIGDSYRHVLHGQLAARELIGKWTPSLSFVKFLYEKDITRTVEFGESFQKYMGQGITELYSDTSVGKSAFIKEPFTGSFDLRGFVTEKLQMHADFALNFVDTTWFTVTGDTVRTSTDTIINKNVEEEHKYSKVNPALFLHIENRHLIPLNVDFAYISKDFYSPLSFVAPVDAFFPFGANLLGAGKFIGRGEASPYTKNMAGVNLQYVPTLPGYGHFKVTYGQHFQLKSAQDLLFFPYRLNGSDLFSLLHSSYSRWGNDEVTQSIPNGGRTYKNRLGDETFTTSGYMQPDGPESGGLRSDYLAMFEGFVPYSNKDEADTNLFYTDSGTIYTKGKWVPSHQKYTFNLEIDGSYDIGPYVHYPRDFFVSLYAAINGVSTSFKPLAFNDKNEDMMLWGTYLRFEPAIALSTKFYVLGLAGFENWRSQKAYIKGADSLAHKAPIDFRDYAYGVGFDWDAFARVGLHGRIKYMQHDDINVPVNNWKTPVVSAEIKMWF